MNNLKNELQSFETELEDLKKLIEDNIKINDKPFEQEQTSDIINDIKEIINVL